MPLNRRQIYRRRRITVFGGLAVVLGLGFYLPATLLAPLPAAAAITTPVSVPVQATASIPWPSYGASAVGAVGYDELLGSSGSTEPVPMASISKIVTALVVLQAKPLGVGESGPDITTTSADVDLWHHYQQLNGSLEEVRSGWTFSQLQLMQLMLIPSANNYTATLTNWAFGSESAYVAAATAFLTEHGLSATTVVEPTGIDPTNTSTASDLVALGELALANPVVSQIVSTDTIEVPHVGEIENSNDLLGIDGVTGLKTGTLEKSGANLLFSANHTIGSSTITVVGVVLGGKDHPTIDKDITAILAAVFAGFREVPLTVEGTPYGSYDTVWGDSADLAAATTTSAIVWSDTPVAATLESNPISTGEAGSEVGALHFTVGATEVDVPLVLTEEIDDPGPGWRLGNPVALL